MRPAPGARAADRPVCRCLVLERCVRRSRGCGRSPCSWWSCSTCGRDRLPGGYVGVDVFFVISGFLITSLHPARGRPRRLGGPGPVLGPTDATAAAGVVPRAAGLGGRRAAVRAAAGVAAVLRRDPGGGAVRRELGARGQLGRLPRRREHPVAGAALLDPVGGGAVLPGLAAAGAARDVAGGGQTRRYRCARPRRGGRSSPCWPSPRSRRWRTRCGSPPPTRPGPTSSPRRAPGSSAPARCWRSRPPATSGSRAVARGLLGWAALVVLLVVRRRLRREARRCPGTAAIWVVVASAVADLGRGSRARLVATPACSSLRPARFLGDISYSIYLWHWPLIILLPYVTDHALTRVDKVSILLATIGLAPLTKRWVEDPVRRARHFGLARPRDHLRVRRGRGRAAHRPSASSRATTSPGRSSRPSRWPPPASRGTAAASVPQSRDPEIEGLPQPRPGGRDRAESPEPRRWTTTRTYGRCNAPLLADPLRPCRFGEPKQGVPHVAVIGDSHARLLMTMVEELVDAGEVTADMFVLGGCPWSTTHRTRPAPDGSPLPRVPPQALPAAGPHGDGVRRRAHHRAADHAARRATSRRVRGLTQAWRRVTRQGVPVLVLRDNPQDVVDDERTPTSAWPRSRSPRPTRRARSTAASKLDRWFDACRGRSAAYAGGQDAST